MASYIIKKLNLNLLCFVICHEIAHLTEYGAGQMGRGSISYCEDDADYYGMKIILRSLLPSHRFEDFADKALGQIRNFFGGTRS